MSKPKSSVPATTKALQAWHSELRHLEKRLGEWANILAERERLLEEQEAAFSAAVDDAPDEVVKHYANNHAYDIDEDCGCTPEDAVTGCDCPKCEQGRAHWKVHGAPPTIILDRRPYPGDKGD